MKAQNKTQPTQQPAEEFLNTIEDDKKREDSFTILNLMKDVTGAEPVMWGSSIIGFGDHYLKYDSGREMDWFLVGFSPRKRYLALYIMSGLKHQQDLLDKLGKHKTSKGCLYVNKLDDINLSVLRQLVEKSVAYLRGK